MIKQIVTEQSKQKLHKHFSDSKKLLEQECQQLLFEQRKLQHKAGMSKQKVAQRFQQALQVREEKIQLLDFKIEQLELLEYGNEIVEKEVDALIDIHVGASWEETIKDKAIIIKDGIIVRID